MKAPLTFVALAALLGLVPQALPGEPGGISLAELRARDVLVSMADGSTVRLGDLLPEGQPAVVEFWATWCKPCRKMAPRMNALHAKYAERGLTILALTIERPDRDRERVMQYVDEAGIAYSVGFAPDGVYEALTGRTERSVPKVFVFGSDGRLVKSIGSYTPMTMRHVESAVEKQIRMR
jgi:thiol-disulfide isomerase/thioredoxin